MQNVGSILGYSRNGYARLTRICECWVLFSGKLGMGMLGCPKYTNCWSYLGYSRNGYARLSQIYEFWVLFSDILGMGTIC